MIRLLDDHAHSFPLQAEPLDLADLSLSIDAAGARRRTEAAGMRLMIEMLRVRLARLLDCPPDDVLDARAEASADWPAYVSRLFADAGVSGMVIDGVWSQSSDVDVSALSATAGVPMWPLLRIEPVVDELLEQDADGPAIVEAVTEFVQRGAAAGAVGCKTVLAYRTGLAVDPSVGSDDAYRSVYADRSTPVRQRAKPFRDFLLRRVFALCADLGLPIQIHTGFGDSDIRLASANPVLLDDVLRTPEGEAVRVVLIHAGFPWHEQLAYLTLVRHNVWAEFSLANLFSPLTTAERIVRLLDLAPADRLLFGTDGHGAPETHWFAASVLRDAWGAVAGRLSTVARGSWVDKVAEGVFHGNAERLYPGVASA